MIYIHSIHKSDIRGSGLQSGFAAVIGASGTQFVCDFFLKQDNDIKHTANTEKTQLDRKTQKWKTISQRLASLEPEGCGAAR